jgi:hypothetical protein
MTNSYKTQRSPRQWYFTLADWMLANPGRPVKEASHVNGGPLHAAVQTLYAISQTDMFRAHLTQRQEAMRRNLDFGLVHKTLEMADLTSDLILQKMKEKRTQIPLKDLMALNGAVMDRLGYGPKAAPTVVVQNNDQRTQVAVTPAHLEAARALIRRVETQATAPLQLEHIEEDPVDVSLPAQ